MGSIALSFTHRSHGPLAPINEEPAMNTKRFLLAAVILTAVSACSRDATAPEPAARAPRVSPVTTATTDSLGPTVAPPTDSGGDDGTGGFGSGCCVRPSTTP